MFVPQTLQRFTDIIILEMCLASKYCTFIQVVDWAVACTRNISETFQEQQTCCSSNLKLRFRTTSTTKTQTANIDVAMLQQEEQSWSLQIMLYTWRQNVQTKFLSETNCGQVSNPCLIQPLLVSWGITSLLKTSIIKDIYTSPSAYIIDD